MAETALITPRRNFLIRALGFTATGATLTVPVVALATPEARLAHHLKGVSNAVQELFPAWHVKVWGNCLNDLGQRYYRDQMVRGERNWACLGLTCGPDTEGELHLPLDKRGIVRG